MLLIDSEMEEDNSEMEEDNLRKDKGSLRRRRKDRGPLRGAKNIAESKEYCRGSMQDSFFLFGILMFAWVQGAKNIAGLLGDIVEKEDFERMIFAKVQLHSYI